MYTMHVGPKQTAVPPSTPASAGVFQVSLDRSGAERRSTRPHEAAIVEPSAVIWGTFFTHFMDIYVPGL